MMFMHVFENTAMSDQSEHVLITGGTSGIGYQLARIFAEDGYDLILVARDQSELDRVKSELETKDVHVHTIAKDLFYPQAAEELYNEIKERGLNVGVLVNDAGQGQYGLFVEGDIERYIDIIQLNIISLTVLTHKFLKDMVARNSGKILQLASIASETPGPYQAVYHATKAYVLSLTEALINEVKDTAVTITALQPGATNTDFFRKADMLESKIVEDPSKLSDPAEVARDGYEALMKGDDKVVSGFKNKVMTTMSNVMPDTMVAEQMRKMQEPREKKE